MIRRALVAGGAIAVLAVSVAAARGAPEGPRFAFLRLDRAVSRLELVTAAQTGARTQIVAGGRRGDATPLPEFGFAPSWSPDGRLLAFSGTTNGRYRIFVVGAGGGRPRAVPRTQGAFAPVFAPDGRTIAFARARIRSHITLPKNGELPKIYSYDSVTTWTIRLDGSEARRLTPWRNGLEVIPSSFSPDGGVLAASEFDERGLENNAIALKTDESGIWTLAREATRPSFSPDGSRIALITHLAHAEPRLGRYGWYRGALTVMRADGSESKRLARTSFYEQSPPSWDPSGERLAYTEGTNVIEINADGSCRQKVFDGTATRLYYGPVWQPGPGREASRIIC